MPVSEIDEIVLNKLLKKIARNVDYFRGETNPVLDALVDEYNEIAKGDEQAMERLYQILLVGGPSWRE